MVCSALYFSLQVFGDFQMSRVLEDAECAQLRSTFIKTKQEMDDYNKQLEIKWPQLAALERLRYFVPASLTEQYDSIVKKSEHIGLKSDKIVQLLISTDNGKLFVPAFSGDYNTVPLKYVNKELANGMHMHSLELAKLLNVPETVIKQVFVKSNVEELVAKAKYVDVTSNFCRTNKQEIENLRNMIGLDYVPKFITYWAEITYFDKKSESTADTKPSSEKDRPATDAPSVQPENAEKVASSKL